MKIIENGISEDVEVVQATAADLNMTEANSTAILADTANIDTNVGTIAGAVTGTEMQVDVISGVQTDGLTDTEIRATPLVVDLGANNDVTVTSGAITETNSTAILADTANIDTNIAIIAGDTTSLDGKDLMLGTDFSAVLGTTSLILGTQADNVVNTSDGLQTSSFLYGFDGTAWDRLRGDSTNGLTVNLGANNDITMTTLPDTASNDLASMSADLGTIDTDTGNIAVNSATIAGWDNIVGDGASVSGDIAHNAVDAGEPIKTGGIAIDMHPDTDAVQGATEVATADRVNGAFNLQGQEVEGVNPRYNVLDNVSVRYDDSPTTATSTAIECWNYRHASLSFTLEDTSTGAVPTDITFEVEVSPDGTNYFPYSNSFLGAMMYSAASVATAKSVHVEFPIAGQKIRLNVTATGTDTDSHFTVTNASLYLRN